MDKVHSVDTEKNRVAMVTNFDGGKPMPKTLDHMQREFLPTIATGLINIDYQIEAIVHHESTFGTSQEIEPLFFPLIVARDTEGPFDAGQDGMVAAQMQQ